MMKGATRAGSHDANGYRSFYQEAARNPHGSQITSETQDAHSLNLHGRLTPLTDNLR